MSLMTARKKFVCSSIAVCAVSLFSPPLMAQVANSVEWEGSVKFGYERDKIKTTLEGAAAAIDFRTAYEASTANVINSARAESFVTNIGSAWKGYSWELTLEGKLAIPTSNSTVSEYNHISATDPGTVDDITFSPRYGILRQKPNLEASASFAWNFMASTTGVFFGPYASVFTTDKTYSADSKNAKFYFTNDGIKIGLQWGKNWPTCMLSAKMGVIMPFYQKYKYEANFDGFPGTVAETIYVKFEGKQYGLKPRKSSISAELNGAIALSNRTWLQMDLLCDYQPIRLKGDLQYATSDTQVQAFFPLSTARGSNFSFAILAGLSYHF